MLASWTTNQHVDRSSEEVIEEFQRLIDNLPQLIWTSNAHGENYFFNAKWSEFTGLNRDRF